MAKKNVKPITVELKKNRLYYWCQCGESKNQPFCDGSHEAYFCEPILVTVKEDTTKRMCVCKQSGNKPYCDGTHKSLNK